MDGSDFLAGRLTTRFMDRFQAPPKAGSTPA